MPIRARMTGDEGSVRFGLGAAAMPFGQTRGMPDAELRGGFVIAIAPPTLQWATDQMVETLGPETLKKLKVRAGEHLAAILTAAFLHTPPMAIDTAGGADLWFDLSSSPRHGLKPASILTDGAVSAAFEIKSMPGPSRKFNSGRAGADYLSADLSSSGSSVMTVCGCRPGNLPRATFRDLSLPGV